MYIENVYVIFRPCGSRSDLTTVVLDQVRTGPLRSLRDSTPLLAGLHQAYIPTRSTRDYVTTDQSLLAYNKHNVSTVQLEQEAYADAL